MADGIHDQEFRALIVDDDNFILRLFSTALIREGFLCDCAENGDAAWRLAAEHPYDVVVTDLSMPERNGHSLAVDLLSLPDRPLVVVVTGLPDPRMVKDLIARGVDDIVFKPVAVPLFAAKIRALVNRRRLAVSAT